MRVCKTCGQEREDSDFREGHPNSYCRICHAEGQRGRRDRNPRYAQLEKKRNIENRYYGSVSRWKKNNKEKVRAQHARRILRNYGTEPAPECVQLLLMSWALKRKIKKIRRC